MEQEERKETDRKSNISFCYSFIIKAFNWQKRRIFAESAAVSDLFGAVYQS